MQTHHDNIKRVISNKFGFKKDLIVLQDAYYVADGDCRFCRSVDFTVNDIKYRFDVICNDLEILY